MLAMGLLIRSGQHNNLIAGYDEKRVRDPKGLSQWIGRSLILLGIGAFLVFFLSLLFPALTLSLFMLYALVAIPLVSVFTVRGSSRYEKPGR